MTDYSNCPAPGFPFLCGTSDNKLCLENAQGSPLSDTGELPPKRRAGRKKFRETRHPVYRGVRRRNGGKWVCEVREPNKKTRIWLGTYPTPEMAARAHDVAAMALRGRSACLNFKDSAWLLPSPPSSSAKDIRRTAMEAAERFRPKEMEGVEGEQAEGAGGANPAAASAGTATGGGRDSMFFMDDEAVFGMPSLLDSMAEGLLLSPPSCGSPFDDMEDDDADVQLWSYSI
ncbi:Dehydration-responsive element-binding protein 1D [Nymphaea thermarum]|nr:Dehydration-responsive element-binding protein 1D [Nymphaea thermarum]